MSESVLFTIQIIFLLSFLTFAVFAFFYLIAVVIGAPYVPTPKKYMDTMFKFAKLKKGDRFIDLGSGDGRVVIEASKKGAIADGVEINPFLVFISNLRIKISGIMNARVTVANLYSVDFSKYDVIFVAGFVDMMGRIEKIFNKKVKKGTRVICYPFPLPKKKVENKENGVYKYIY